MIHVVVVIVFVIVFAVVIVVVVVVGVVVAFTVVDVAVFIIVVFSSTSPSSLLSVTKRHCDGHSGLNSKLRHDDF